MFRTMVVVSDAQRKGIALVVAAALFRDNDLFTAFLVHVQFFSPFTSFCTNRCLRINQINQ